MKLARIQLEDSVVLVDHEGSFGTALAFEDDEPHSDVLRSWLYSMAAISDSQRPNWFDHEADSDPIDLAGTKLLAPLRAPQKIVAVAANYKDHAAEMNKPVPERPMFFNKSPGSICGPGDAVRFRMDDTSELDYEGELAVVIGLRARDVEIGDALSHVLGYTIGNDVSARDAQRNDGQFFRAKSFDTFCPLGPWIVTADEIEDPQNLAIRTAVNGEVRQDSSTSQMVFGVAELISYASRYFTLEPGDVILTGTPAGVGMGRDPKSFLSDGDEVSIEIEGIGTLPNVVFAD